MQKLSDYTGLSLIHSNAVAIKKVSQFYTKTIHTYDTSLLW